MRHQRLACALAWTVLALIPLCGSFFSPGSLLLPVSQSGAFCRPQTAAAIFRRDRRASGPAIWCSSSQPPLPPPRPPLKAIDRKEVGARLRDLQDRAKRGHANADDVLDLLRWMTDNGVQLELRNYTALLNACAAAAKFGGATLHDAVQVIEALWDQGLTPNTPILNALLKVCSALATKGMAGMDDAFEILEWCLYEPLVLEAPVSLAPSSTEKPQGEPRGGAGRKEEGGGAQGGDPGGAGRREEAAQKRAGREAGGGAGRSEEKEQERESRRQALLASAAGKSAALDGVSYNTLMQICAAEGKFNQSTVEDGAAVFRWMEAAGIVPSIASFGSYLSLLTNLAAHGSASLRHGLEALDWMARDGVAPDTQIFNACLRLCSKDAKSGGGAGVGDGEKLFSEMRDRGLSPDAFSFKALLDLMAHDRVTFVDRARMPDALEIEQRMMQEGLRADAVLLNLLLSCAKADAAQAWSAGDDGGQEEARVAFLAALQVLERFPAKERDSMTYAGVAATAAAAGLTKECISVLSTARQDGFPSTTQMYNVILCALIRGPGEEVVSRPGPLRVANGGKVKAKKPRWVDYQVLAKVLERMKLDRVHENHISRQLLKEANAGRFDNSD
ncbi:hypothetical protein T484DRAFT_2458428 [Baffinella frigidus]|nr:hypothetical protein T484DRAFT_2458428 [Cryptophyta sp. CCMP2293]